MPPNDPPAKEGESGHWFIRKALTAISFGLAVHYTEIQKAWQICGSNSLCKAEKLVMYFTAIFGIASPSILLSQLTKKYANKFWMTLKGTQLFEKDSYWSQTAMYVGIYSAMEYQLSFWWDWVQYATECLKVGVCENDDILVWIHNMKLGYCNKTEVEYVHIELDCVEGDCTEVPDNDFYRKIKDSSDWCVVFFNELPLILSAVMIWVIYVLSVTLVDPEDIQGNIQSNEGSQTRSGAGATRQTRPNGTPKDTTPHDKKKRKGDKTKPPRDDTYGDRKNDNDTDDSKGGEKDKPKPNDDDSSSEGSGGEDKKGQKSKTSKPTDKGKNNGKNNKAGKPNTEPKKQDGDAEKPGTSKKPSSEPKKQDGEKSGKSDKPVSTDEKTRKTDQGSTSSGNKPQGAGADGNDDEQQVFTQCYFCKKPETISIPKPLAMYCEKCGEPPKDKKSAQGSETKLLKSTNQAASVPGKSSITEPALFKISTVMGTPFCLVEAGDTCQK